MLECLLGLRYINMRNFVTSIFFWIGIALTAGTAEPVNVVDYGANGVDSLADDQAIQAAIKVALKRNTSIYFPAGTYYITETIMLDYHNKNVGITGDGMHATYIKVQSRVWRGMSFALYSRTCVATFQDFSLVGSRSIPLSGILFDFYGGHGNHRNLRVANFNGFGIKYVAIWDSHVENVIVEHCGNQKHWAFSVFCGDDTSNHTTFDRLQVELAHDKAMYVDPGSLNLVFIGIHSERLIRETSTVQDISHHLQGGACTYLNARIQNRETTSRILLGNAEGSYTDFRCGGQDVEISYGAQTTQRIQGLTCKSLSIPASNISQVYLENVRVGGSLSIVDQVSNFPTFSHCVFLGEIEHQGGQSKALFLDCTITNSEAFRSTQGKNIFKSSLNR